MRHLSARGRLAGERLGGAFAQPLDDPPREAVPNSRPRIASEIAKAVR